MGVRVRMRMRMRMRRRRRDWTGIWRTLLFEESQCRGGVGFG